MEITKKEGDILEFIKKFRYCRAEHIKIFVDKTASVQKRIDHLLWQKEIFEIEKGIYSSELEIKNHETKENIIKVLDVVSIYKEQNKIMSIEPMDEPYYIAAQTQKGKYAYYTLTNKGKEVIQLKLIDNENRGNTILIIENEEQIKNLKILTTKILKVHIYKEITEHQQI